MARLYTSTSFRPIINDRLDPVFDEKKEVIVVGRTAKEQKREGQEGLLDIGVVCEKQASGRSFHGYRVLMDAKFPHIVFICGKRGGGKSYTLGVIAEELCKTKIGIGTVIVDPIGIYWSMKKENQNKKEIAELKKWDLEPVALDNIRILGPPGLYGQDGGMLDGSFSIKPAELTSEEWCLVFGLDRFKIQGLLIGEALEKVREGYKIRKGPNEVEFIPGKGSDYDVGDIVDAIDKDVDLGSEERGYARATRRSVIARFKAAERWGIFSENGTPIDEISVWDRVTVIDVSHPRLENQIRALIVGILAKKILQARIVSSRMEEMGADGDPGAVLIPVTWLMIDEAHLLIPRRGLTAASKPLIEYAKLGRKPGCALVLATQRPAATDDDILSQVDMLVGHSLGLEDDIAALLKRVPAKLPAEMADSDFIRGIPSGFSLLADQKTQQRALLVQIRPRLTHHSGKEAMPAKQAPPPQKQPATTIPQPKPVETGIAGIDSIWGDEPGATPSHEEDEEFEIVSASDAMDEIVELPQVSMVEPEEEELVESSEDDGEIPSVVLGMEERAAEEDTTYADGSIMETIGFDLIEPEPEEEEASFERESDAELEEEMVGPGALEEDIAVGDAEEPEEGVESRTISTSGLAPEIQAREGEERESFPIVLRRDSAKGLAIKGMRTTWAGRPKEYIESIELVQLPMFESTLVSHRKRRIGGKIRIRAKLLFDAHMREIVTDFREFKRSRGISRLCSLTENHLSVIGCIVDGRV
ncbi:MAG: ATP-binding protein, partial [Theionarchaea archaeon]|nr:ATP-binding protein [Theionarchaea archaeon]